jgi:aryl-alcohol dehydrogenase-like predicted oxidoreductase
MEYRVLGRTGVRVSELCLGSSMFGAMGNAEHGECTRVIHAALEAGINFVDTADMYSAGEAEEIVGRAIRGRRDEVVVGTKFRWAMGPGPNQQGASRRWIMKACEDSLRRLQTDHIDLYQIHRVDTDTDIDETLGALTDLVRAGKVRYIGSSTFPPSEIVRAQWVAERRHRERLVCEQPPYSMLVRGAEAEVLPTCERFGMGVITWSPLAAGWLSGRWRKGAREIESVRGRKVPDRYDLSVPHNQRKLGAVDALGQIADEAGLPLLQMAIAFVLNHPAVTSAIIGPRTIEHFADQIGAEQIRLDQSTLDRIDEIVTPGTNFSWTDAGYTPPAIAETWRRRRR